MESALRGVRADLTSPALNMSPTRWNICLLRFHPKHKNRLFITGKTDLTVGFPGGARLRDAGNWTGDVGQRRRAGRDRPRRGGGGGGGGGRGHVAMGWGRGTCPPPRGALRQSLCSPWLHLVAFRWRGDWLVMEVKRFCLGSALGGWVQPVCQFPVGSNYTRNQMPCWPRVTSWCKFWVYFHERQERVSNTG